MQHPHRVIRETGEDSTLVALFHPKLREIVHAHGRSANFGRKIL